MKIIITGGCGFIGQNFIKLIINKTNYKVLNIDKQTYAGKNYSLIKNLPSNRYSFIKKDINNRVFINELFYKFKPDAIINFAAESHVDRSIASARNFIYSNILGVYNLLEVSKNYSLYYNKKINKKFTFFQISTDEVYGSLRKKEKPFSEENKFYPNSPYSASKASADLLVRSYNKTYGIKTLISNCSNNYGPGQDKEKLIPKIITNALKFKKIPIYGDGSQIRDWIYVEDHCRAILKILKNGKSGETYNIGGDEEIRNIDLTKKILNELKKLYKKDFLSLIEFVNDRPAHDTRYAINNKKITTNLNWKPIKNFNQSILKTIKWYIENYN